MAKITDSNITVFVLLSLLFLALSLQQKFTTLAFIFAIVISLDLYLVRENPNTYHINEKTGNTLSQLGYGAIAFIIFIVISTGIKSIIQNETTYALVAVFVFMLISLAMVYMTNEIEGAIWFHILTNGLSILSQTGYINLGSIYPQAASVLHSYSTITLSAALNTIQAGQIVSLVLVLLGWAIIIPISETKLVSSGFGILTRGKRIQVVAAYAVVLSVTFMLFHIFAKSTLAS